MGGRRAAALDVGLYAASALATGAAAFLATIPLYREVSRLQAPAYAAGAVVAAWLALRGGDGRRRTWLAVALVLATLVLPLALESLWRVRTGPGFHAQSEAIITEEAARAFVHGHDPYAATYLHGALAARPLPTRTHFPYLPLMLVFGLPRALAGTSAWTDARVWFAVGTASAFAVSLRLWGTRTPLGLRSAQLLLALPTGAFLLATGGDDVPVVALMLLALVLLGRDRPGWSGLAAGLAAATKQTAWLLLPFVVAAAWRRSRADGVRAASAILAVALSTILPFAAWHPGPFVEDVLKFPLGIGAGRSAARSPTIGGLLVRVWPSGRIALVVALAVTLVVALLGLLAGVRAGAAGAATGAGLLFMAAVVLAPAGRIAYLVYPVDLLAWGRLLDLPRRRDRVEPAPGPPPGRGRALSPER